MAPTNPGNRFVTFTTGVLLSALLSTGVTGSYFYLNDFNSSGAPSSVKIAANAPINAFVTATGSTTIKYPAVCIPNPFKNLSYVSSGAVVRLTYTNITNPNGAGGDIGFTKGCGDSFGSGSSLITDTSTSTGASAFYTTGTAIWNTADFIKFTLRKDPTSSFSARIRGSVEQLAR